MSKREHGQTSEAADMEGSRSKRRKEAAGSSSDVDVAMSDPVGIGGESGGTEGGSKEEVAKEQGLKLWQTVKDAVNKEGRILSLDFLRKPPKRQYPDYYQLIQRPIALDDIKKQLENGGYPSLEDVKLDFELCFNNAKQYNMKDSDIWRDAKDLLKIVNKAYNKLAPADDDGENVDGEGKKKSKAPNLGRLIKSRLQKLVDKTDDSGRVLSTEFMELPSKKDWPMYYKQIKRPQCFENIFKHIKRKEYRTAADFAADVELVFSNAFTFNQEHTRIWEDARALREHFRQLMADLPPPFALPDYSKPSNGKIKLKMSAAVQPSSSTTTSPQVVQHSNDEVLPSSNSILRIPATSSAEIISRAAPAASTSTSSLPVHVPKPQLPPPVLPPTSTQIHSSSTTPQTVNQSLPNATFSHYPNASYLPPVDSTPPVPAASSSISNNSLKHTQSVSNSPAPQPIHQGRQIKSISLRMEPHGRAFNLDYQDGVKTWAMRLGPGETSVSVKNVMFLDGDDGESSGGEEHAGVEEEEEEEPDVEAPVKNGKKKGKRGRGRPKGSTKAAMAKLKVVQIIKKKTQKHGEIQLKLNGSLVKEEEEHEGEWMCSLSVGSNIIEVGEAGGLTWKVYAERLGGA